MAHDKPGLFGEDRSGFSFREIFTPEREGPLRPFRNTPQPPGKGGPPIKAASGMSSQAAAYLARTTGGNAGGNATNIATLIDGLVADGVWAKLDCLYVLAQQNQSDARLNLIGANFSLTSGLRAEADPHVLTFTSYVGFSGFVNGLDTGFIPSSAPSPKFTLNSSSVGGWMYDAVNTNSLLMGTVDNKTGVYPTYGGGVTFYAFSNSAYATASPAGVGLYSVDGTATTIAAYINGANKASTATAPVALDAVSVKIGNASALWPGKISAAFIGASLGAAGQLALYNRLRTYMTAVGVP